MAAPKRWGYTRDQAIGDELLVSWADGDLTAAVAKELEERLLASPADRQSVAGYARDCAQSARAEGPRSDMLNQARAALLGHCIALVEDPSLPSPANPARQLPALRTLFSTGVGLLVTLAIIAWMWREFAR